MYPDVFFNVLGFPIDMYFIMFLIGIAACLYVLKVLCAKRGVSKKVSRAYFDLALIAIGVGYLTSILWQGIYNLIDSGSFTDENGAIGMTFLGGLIGGAGTYMIGMYLIFKKDREAWQNIIEIAPAVIAIAHAFGRVGCVFAGCCYGRPTDSWIGVRFEDHAHNVIPTNLLEAIFLFALFGILFYMALKKINFAMPTYLVSYGLFRFIIEFFRGDDRGAFVPGLSPSQAWSLVMVIGGAVLLWFVLKQKNQPKTPSSC